MSNFKDVLTFKNYTKPKAFISCSLREQDKWYVDWIEAIVQQMGYSPFGTVGKYSFSPEPIWKQIHNNIQKADCIVVAATPRYVQQDFHDRKVTGRGISEMIHVEIGMAVASNRPILVFVLPGTKVDAFIRPYTMYIEIDPRQKDHLQNIFFQIERYFESAHEIISNNREKKEVRNSWARVGGVLAFIGGLHMVETFFKSPSSK